MRYVRPDRVEDALALLSEGDWSILAGGTDFYPGLNGAVPSGQVLDITAIDDLRRVARVGDCWTIGATATWSDIIAAELPPAFDCLKEAAREIGSVQIQNRATLAGNICNASPAADGVPPLLSLNAIVEVASASRKRRVPLEGFLKGSRETTIRDDEIVTGVLVPEASARGASAFVKLGARKYLVISISMVAARIACDRAGHIVDAAVSVGACSVVAQRLRRLETALIGTAVGADPAGLVSETHLTGLRPIDDVRATAGYRRNASLALVRRAVARAAAGLPS